MSLVKWLESRVLTKKNLLKQSVDALLFIMLTYNLKYCKKSMSLIKKYKFLTLK